MNIDDLAAGESEIASRSQEWHHHRFANGTLRVDDWDQHIPASTVVKKIRQGSSQYHLLDLSFYEVTRDGITKILQELTPPPPEDNQEHPMLQLVARLNYRDHLFNPGFSNHIRELNLTCIGLTNANIQDLCALLTNNSALTSLNLSGNELGMDPDELAKLGVAVGSSALDTFTLNSNPLLADSFIAFLDSLPENGCSLNQLNLSNVLHQRSVTRDPEPSEETLEAARAVAALLSNPRRCRNIEHLRVDANSFGYRGVRAITASIVGSVYDPDKVHDCARSLRNFSEQFSGSIMNQQRRPNRSLVDITMFGNVAKGWERSDTQHTTRIEEQGNTLDALSSRLSRVPADRLESLLCHLAERPELRRRCNSAATKIEFETNRFDDIDVLFSNIEGSMEEWAKDLQELVEIGSGVDLFDWKNLIETATKQNKDLGKLCRWSASRVLSASRIVGCRARHALSTNSAGLELSTRQDSSSNPPDPVNRSRKSHDLYEISPFRFLDLPPELRLLILRFRDTDGLLSDEQFSNVVSFACEPSTLDYGAKHREWTRVVVAAREQREGRIYSSPTLPARTWLWSECFEQRSAPRELEVAVRWTDPYAIKTIEQKTFLQATATEHVDAFALIPKSVLSRATDKLSASSQRSTDGF